ncbi:MAG TPA: prephenate dehydrogenase/arogenate dehydrogenase family protein [bacterium]|nr:prephenate dehydrogenase/arogenate dehydrogenase family protein [bacterium]
MSMFENIGIAGLGLLGGSIALSVKELGLSKRISGFTRSPKTLERAISLGAVDDGLLNFEEFIKDVDFVVLSAPISANIELARIIGRQKPSLLFTDVGSTKKEIVKMVEDFFPSGHRFVGSHPMAGSEKKGIDQANPFLFKGKTVIITPVSNCSPSTIETIEDFWNKIGARTVRMDADTHDDLCAYTSHLPHLVAFLLVSVFSEKMDDPNVAACIGAGFRDTTRIAASDQEIWSEIFLSNSENILNAIEKFKEHLNKIEDMIEKKDAQSLKNMIEKIRKIRSTI